MKKVCPNCHKKYYFNPDINKGLVCPRCGSGYGKKESIKDIILELIKAKKTKKQ